MSKEQPLLDVKNLSVAFRAAGVLHTVVRNVSFIVQAGERVGIVGESGSGKTVTALSIMQLHDPARVQYQSGEINYEGKDLLRQSAEYLRELRGKHMAMIFQEPAACMNPVYPIGPQLVEPLMLHEGLSYQTTRARMIELLNAVELRRAAERFNDYPHVFSGGELQRIMIAMALSCRPKILIADEPTTALDVTIRAEVVSLLKKLQQQFNMAVLFISHDLNLMQDFADRVLVMNAGKLVEQKTKDEIFEHPAHPYTKKLMACRPSGQAAEIDADAPTLMSVTDMMCHFPIKKGLLNRTVDVIKAVNDVSVDLKRGETLGIVGESGSGKSTLAKCILQLQRYRGNVIFQGSNLAIAHKHELRKLRKDLQVVFQDPYSSLSPRMTVGQILDEGMKIHFPGLTFQQRRERFLQTLRQVDLPEDILNRYPHEFSGGQRQRIAIARVMVLKPRLVILDEPTSSLDVSVQKQILNLLRSLQKEYAIAYIFISHDLSVIKSMAHRVVVLWQGNVVERGSTEEIFSNPQAAYTQKLLSAAIYR